jgi:hypothetical protein
VRLPLFLKTLRAPRKNTRLGAIPSRNAILAYSNFGNALIASLVAPGRTNLPSCCFNWVTGIAISCRPRPTNPPAPTITKETAVSGAMMRSSL